MDGMLLGSALKRRSCSGIRSGAVHAAEVEVVGATGMMEVGVLEAGSKGVVGLG